MMNAIKTKTMKLVKPITQVVDGTVRLVARDRIPGVNIVSVEDRNGGRTLHMVPDLENSGAVFAA